jgi:cellulose biosynthesis protein BcsQ
LEVHCSIGNNAEITRCVELARDWIVTAKPWIEVVLGIAGLGTFAVVSILLWMLKRVKRDVDAHQEQAKSLQNELIDARAERNDALSRARSGERMIETLSEQLKGATAPLDEALATSQLQVAELSQQLQAGLSAGSSDSAAFWSRDHGRRPENFQVRMRDSKPVLLFANQKGGVGKTTLSANIAAAFAQRGERVLTIDLDYQGSLTSLMLAQSNTQPEQFPSTVDLLLEDALPTSWPRLAIDAASERLHYISCWYSFEKLERNLEYRWILDDTDDDIRFRLSRAVLSSHVQETYDRVIIDAPPRMTTGFLNGLCAATHLFVPTVVDNVSAVAVGTFARQFRELRSVLNPQIEFAGIIGTMTTLLNGSGPFTLPNNAEPAAARAEAVVRKILNSHSDFFIRGAVMARTPRVSYSAEDGIAYLQAPETRPMFDALADQIARRSPLRN